MYILKCSDESYYTGSTWNLEKRLAEHQAGLGAKHTCKRLPVELVYFEESERVEDAYRREKQIQGWSRKKKEALMAGDTNALHQLAICRNDTQHSGFGSAQPADSTTSSLSEVEGNNPGAKK
jgi:putative endonuclease